MYILWHALWRSFSEWILDLSFRPALAWMLCQRLSKWVSRYSRNVLSWSYCFSIVGSGSSPNFYLINFVIKESTIIGEMTWGGGGEGGGGGWYWWAYSLLKCLILGLASVTRLPSIICCLYSAAAKIRAWLSALSSSHLLEKAYLSLRAYCSWFSLSLLQWSILCSWIFSLPSFFSNFLIRYSF